MPSVDRALGNPELSGQLRARQVFREQRVVILTDGTGREIRRARSSCNPGVHRLGPSQSSKGAIVEVSRYCRPEENL
jgi:hypothetical protein